MLIFEFWNDDKTFFLLGKIKFLLKCFVYPLNSVSAQKYFQGTHDDKHIKLINNRFSILQNFKHVNHFSNWYCSIMHDAEAWNKMLIDCRFSLKTLVKLTILFCEFYGSCSCSQKQYFTSNSESNTLSAFLFKIDHSFTIWPVCECINDYHFIGDLISIVVSCLPSLWTRMTSLDWWCLIKFSTDINDWK